MAKELDTRMKFRSKYVLSAIFFAVLLATIGCQHAESPSLGKTETVTEMTPAVEPTTSATAESDIATTETIIEATAEPTTVPTEKPDVHKTAEVKVNGLLPLHVEGNGLKDGQGNPIQLKGLSTHGLSWFPQYVNQELFTELAAEWNCNVVRLAMYSAEYNGYCTGGNQEELKQLIRDGVQYAENAGMYVIVDWHVLGEGDPNIYKEEAKAFFDEMSKEFADKQHVIYEICNEPNGRVSWSSVKAYALEVIPVIRANDDDAVIIVGTPTWSQDVDKAAAEPITEYDNIMYALHFYAATHKEDLRNRMVKALEGGLPIIVSEYGICSADGNGGIDAAQAQAWIDLMNEKNISYVAWNLSNKNETSAVFASGCNKSYGFTTDDLSEGGRWLYKMLTAGEPITQSEVTTKEEPVTQSEVTTKEEPEYTATVTGNWESDGKKYEQYAVTLKNTSGQEMTGWQIEIEFKQDIALSDSWNGQYTVKGNKLMIQNAEYNGAVASDAEVKDIGFIIYYAE